MSGSKVRPGFLTPPEGVQALGQLLVDVAVGVAASLQRR